MFDRRFSIIFGISVFIFIGWSKKIKFEKYTWNMDFLHNFLPNADSIELHNLLHKAFCKFDQDINKVLDTFHKCIKDTFICMM